MMNLKEKLGFIILLLIFLMYAALANAGSPYLMDENINSLGNTIYNMSNANSTNFYQDGNRVVDVAGTYNMTGNLNFGGNSLVNALDINASGTAYALGLNASMAEIGNLPVARSPTGGSWTLSSNLNIDSNTLFIDQSNNRVGIGTTSLSYPFVVNGVSYASHFLSAGDLNGTGIHISGSMTDGVLSIGSGNMWGVNQINGSSLILTGNATASWIIASIAASNVQAGTLASGNFIFQDNATADYFVGNVDTEKINEVQFYVLDNNGSDIQAKIDSCPGSYDCTVFIPPGTYNLNSSISITSGNIKLKGIGEVIINMQNSSATEIISVSGSSNIGAVLNVTTDVNKGVNLVIVNSSTGINADDMIYIRAEDTVGTQGIKKQEIFIVKNVTGNNIRLKTDTNFNFTIANNATVREIDYKKNIEISGLLLNGSNSTGTQRCISGDGTRDSRFHDLTLQNCGGYGILTYGFNNRIYDNLFQNILNSGLGYAVGAIYSSKNLHVYDNIFSNIDEAYDCGGSSAVHGTPINTFFYKNHIEGAVSNGVDTHTACTNQFFDNNYFINIRGHALKASGHNTYFTNNIIKDVYLYGISSFGYEHQNNEKSDIYVIGNTFENTNWGTGAWTASLQNWSNVIFHYNTFNNNGNTGYSAGDLRLTSGNDNFSIIGNVFSNSVNKANSTTIFINDIASEGYVSDNEFYNNANAVNYFFNTSTVGYPHACDSTVSGMTYHNESVIHFCDGNNWIQTLFTPMNQDINMSNNSIVGGYNYSATYLDGNSTWEHQSYPAAPGTQNYWLYQLGDSATYTTINQTLLNDINNSLYLNGTQESDLNVNASNYWDNHNVSTDITEVGTLTHLEVINNATFTIDNFDIVQTDNFAGVCYQESANTSNQTGIDGNCGLLYTGTYNWDGSWGDSGFSEVNPTDTIDGNYATWNYIFTTYSTGNIYFNYSKPNGAIRASTAWQIKDNNETVNLTLTESCWEKNPIELRVSSQRRISAQNSEVNWYCKNSSGWDSLIEHIGPNYENSKVHEEAIFWNISTDYKINLSGDTYIDTLTVVNNVSASWFKGIFDWVVSSASTLWLSFNGTSLAFNESQLNVTINNSIDARQGLLDVNNSDYFDGFNSSQFLRSDEDDTTSGSLTLNGNISIKQAFPTIWLNNSVNGAWTENDTIAEIKIASQDASLRGDIGGITFMADTTTTNPYSSIVFKTRTSGAVTERVRIGSNGNFYVGSTIRNEKLEFYPNTDMKAVIGRAIIGNIAGGDQASFSHYDWNTTVGFALTQNNKGATIVNSASGNDLGFAINDAVKMVVDSTGKIGIGTTSPNQELQVVGDVNVSGNVTAENVFLPAYIRVPSNATIAVFAANNWTNITLDKKQTALQQNIGHTWNDNTNETITIVDAGIYQVDYTISVRDSAANPAAHVGFRLYSITGDTTVKGSYKEIDTSKQNEDIFQDTSFLTEFTAGEQVKMQFVSDDTTVSITPHGTFHDSPSSAQISIHKVANA